MVKRIESLKIIDNKRLNKNTFLLELHSDRKLPEMKPGQFVQVKVDNSPETFLRRPFSLHDVDYEKRTIKLLIQIAGKGTLRLSLIQTGEFINIIYPLGNSFTLPETGQKSLIVGGGCGIAPLLFLGKYLKNNGFIPDILLGFKNSDRLIEFNEYTTIGKVFLSTEDGSRGEKGFVSEHPLLGSGKYDLVYCCGPDPMMKAIGGHCRKNHIKCEVTLENLMGCGIGVCLCCVVDTVSGNRCSCTDGPVFNIEALKW